MAGALQSTAPGSGTERSLGGKDRLFLRWVFPRYQERGTPLDGGPVTLGRDPSCQVVLDDDKVSREHARIERVGPVLAIADLGSRNGTLVDGRRESRAPLVKGTVVRVGSSVGLIGDCEVRPFGQQADGILGGIELAMALEPARRAAQSPLPLPILIEGETGTGKEGVAHAVHLWSRRPGRLIPVNSSAVPAELFEATFFGHVRGAFSGAVEGRLGHFREAAKGTLFLDELADLPLAAQAKLLRAVESGEVTPVGESRPVRVDVRLVAAVQRPLSELAEEGRFREDLLARLAGVVVRLPPLRERREDIAPLTTTFLGLPATGVEPALIERLCLHAWPHNVRELRRVCETLVALHGHEGLLRRSHLPVEVLYGDARAAAPLPSPPPRDPDRAAVERALTAAGGNVMGAARLLNISKQRLYRRAEALGVDVHQYRRR